VKTSGYKYGINNSKVIEVGLKISKFGGLNIKPSNGKKSKW